MLHDPCCCCFCCLSALYADADIRKKKQTEICLNEEAIVAATHTHDDVSIKSTDKRKTHRACLSKHSESAYKLRCIVCGTINSCGRILLLAGYLFFFSSSFFFCLYFGVRRFCTALEYKSHLNDRIVSVYMLHNIL